MQAYGTADIGCGRLNFFEHQVYCYVLAYAAARLALKSERT